MAKWKVGITGGMGSGKTYCARIFGRLGIPVYYSDERAQFLMLTDPDVRGQLSDLLGSQVYDENGQLNKDFMRQQVFENPSTREAINAIVHPAVGRDHQRWHKMQISIYTLNEAALLVESGSYRRMDHLIMVQAPLAIRTQRIMARDSIDVLGVRKRMESQLPDEAKEKAADIFINNSGCYPLFRQILEIHKKLIS